MFSGPLRYYIIWSLPSWKLKPVPPRKQQVDWLGRGPSEAFPCCSCPIRDFRTPAFLSTPFSMSSQSLGNSLSFTREDLGKAIAETECGLDWSFYSVKLLHRLARTWGEQTCSSLACPSVPPHPLRWEMHLLLELTEGGARGVCREEICYPLLQNSLIHPHASLSFIWRFHGK